MTLAAEARLGPSLADAGGRPPEGTATVAFLFARGEAGEERLEVLRSCVARFGGRELDATVDSFPASFSAPSAALACGRAMIRATGNARIGIHCGEPLEIEDGRYFGAAVWTAARLCGRAEPGEIVLSSTAADLLPEDARSGLTAAGSVRLKGVAEPVQVYEESAVGADPPDAPPHGPGTRVLSILTVDQVGSTAILDVMGDRAARTVHTALMDVLREEVDEHGGAEVEYGGDGLAVRFDSALAAVDCATAMQRDAARHRQRFPDAGLVLRGGVVSGEADPGSHASVRPLLVASARLAERAEAEEILVSGVSASLATDRREHRFMTDGDRGGLLLDWRPATHARSLPPGLHEAEFFVGREAELDRLRDAWEVVGHGYQRVIALNGGAGMGKTGLAARFARMVADEGTGAATVLYGRAAELETHPLEALADAVSGVLAAASRADLRRLLGERAAVLAPVLPVVADRLPTVAPVDLPEPTRPAAWARAFDDLLAALCAEAPVLLVLDDLQNASAALLAAVRVLAEHDSPRPLLLVGLYRRPESGRAPIEAALDDAVARGAAVERLSLQGLDGADTAELVAALTGAAPDEAALRAVEVGAEGRPRFVVQFALARLRTNAREDAHRAFTDLASDPGDREVRRLTSRVLQLQRLGHGPDDGAGHADPTSGANPYRGLAPFDEAAAAWFFGREQATAELVARVAASRVSAVVGASGSGKSSLVHAGLLPALARNVLPGSGSWNVVPMVPGSHPVDALASSLAAAFGTGTGAVRTALRTGALLDVVSGLGPSGQRLLLVVDQAEEVFTTADEGERDRFAELLSDAVSEAGRFSVVLVVRSEFYGDWAAYPRLAELLERNDLLVGPMSDSELRRAIEAPALRAGLVVEPALVDAVVADVAGEPGALPLLSTAMSATWQRRRGRSLTLSVYAETGGVRGAVAQLADAAYTGLREEWRPTARALLLRLAQPYGADVAIDVRRRAPLEEVLELGDDAADVLHAFIEQRLVITDDSTVEVAHEALLREWPLLRGWLEEDRAGRALQQELAGDARTWQRRERDPSLLYRGTRLALAAEATAGSGTALTSAEREFLAASTAGAADELDRAHRTALRLRRLVVGLVAVTVAALLATVLVVVQGRTAAERATEASAAAVTAQAAALAGTQEDLGGLLALAAQQLHPSTAAAAAVLAAADASPDLQRVIPLGGAGAVTEVVSGNGRAAAVVGPGNAVRDFDLATGRQLGRLVVPGLAADAQVAISSTGRYLAVAEADELRVLDSRTGAVVVVNRTLSTVGFLAGDVLAGFDLDLGDNGRAVYLDPASGRPVPFHVPAFGATAALSADGRIEVWSETPTGPARNPIFTRLGPTATRVLDIITHKQVGRSIPGVLAGMSADGRLLAVLRDPDLVILERSTRRILRTIHVGSWLTSEQVAAASPTALVAFDPSARTLAFEGADSGYPVHLVDVATGTLRTEPLPLSHAYSTPAFTGTSRLVVQTNGGAAVIGPPSTSPAPRAGSRLSRNEYNPFPRAFVATDPSGSTVAEVVPSSVPGAPDRYRIAPATRPGAGPVVAPGAGRRFDDAPAAFSADGRRLATLEWDPRSGADTAISVWDTRTGRRLAVVGPFFCARPDEQALPVLRIAFVRGTDELAAVTQSGPPSDGGTTSSAQLQLWSLKHDPRSPIVDVSLTDTVVDAISADGRTLATSASGAVSFWSTRTGRLTVSAPVPDLPYDLSGLRFTPDGTHLVGGEFGSAVRWRVGAARAPEWVRLPVDGGDYAWAVSPDGTTVADVGPNGVEFRSFTTGRVEAEAQSAASTAAILAFVGGDDTVVVWDGSRLQLVDRSGQTVPLGPPRTPPPVGVVDDDPDIAVTSSALVAAVTSGSDVVVDSYPSRPADAKRRVCEIAGRDLTRAEWDRYLPGVTQRPVCPAPRAGL